MCTVDNTAQELIRQVYDQLTRAERQLVGVILENYPSSGMGSITRLAENAGVSTPTVARLVQKLGYSGFPGFQEALRAEVAAAMSDPIAKHDTWSRDAPDAHILNRFADSVLSNIRQTLAGLDVATFDRVTDILADTNRRIFVTGGRITHTLSEYFHLHMQVIRRDVRHVRGTSNAWPHALLDMAKGDVVVIYDIRRYENSVLRLAEIAASRGAEIILITDQWQSPVAAHASVTLNCRIEAPSAWDSTIAMMLLTETIIAAVQEKNWSETKTRMGELEEMFDSTRIFRKFV